MKLDGLITIDRNTIDRNDRNGTIESADPAQVDVDPYGMPLAAIYAANPHSLAADRHRAWFDSGFGRHFSHSPPRPLPAALIGPRVY